MKKNNGILVINKPADWTSFDVVNKIKSLLKTKKVGHLGSLDPMATGVLLITIGKATKLFNLMQEKQKTYIARFQFGLETDSLDITGSKTNSSNKEVRREDIENVLPSFIGKISQIPPKFSAKSVGGVRAYSLARKGIEFDLKPKNIQIYSLKILDFKNNCLELEIMCGSGTYIRALGRDLAYSIGNYATMTSLVRTEMSNFTLTDAINIYELNEKNIFDHILPIKSCLNYEEIFLTDAEKHKILNGQTIIVNQTDGIYMLNDSVDTIALVNVSKFRAKMSLFLG